MGLPENQRDLPKQEVHVWKIGLDVSELTLHGFRATLCVEELRRAERFRFPDLRRRFIAGRGALRQILAKYLRIDPQQLKFSYNPYGKPSLFDSSSGLQFNVSHSNDLMVVAICRGWPIGVDIEKEDLRFHAMDIAARFFCERERIEIERAGVRAFFQFWTAKEAVLKASSLGLALELSKLEIALSPLRIVALEDAAKINGESWHLTAFSPAEGYSGALAVPR
ncbi:MAG TPA: 4'-phosphopantetheinyl transferase superfamily protein, partial [Terrimicrobiaceae bacterium]